MKLWPQPGREGAPIIGAALMLLACLTAAAVLPALADQPVDRIVASVDGEPITMHDVRTFAAAHGEAIPDASDPRAPDMIRKTLKELIEEKLLESETKNFADQVDESQVDKFIANVREQSHLTDEQFRQQLLRSGTSYEQFRQRARLEIEKMMMLDRDVRSKVEVSDAEIKAYYDAHRTDFINHAERYRLAQILIAVAPNAPAADIAAARKKAEKVRKMAASGGDFAALAAKYSDDDSKSKGGELGDFAPGEILDSIGTAVAKLKPGDVSQVVQTSHGFHILKLEEHDLPGPMPLKEVRDQIRERLTDEKAKTYFHQWLDQDLAKSHHVESFY